MPYISFDILLSLPAFALVFFRLSGLVMVAPIYSSSMIPARARVGLVVVLSAMIFPLVARQVPGDLTLTTALVGGVGEMMIGASMGLALSIFIMGAEVAGLIVGRQAGIALGQVFDPTQDTQATVSGQVYTITLTLIFLAAGGHRALMAALLDTYEVVPVLSYELNDSIVVLLVEMLSASLILGLRLAGPVLIALFLTGTALGFLSRTMPQMNILTVGFIMRVIVALAIAGLALGACEGLLIDAVWDALTRIREAWGLDPTPVGLTS